MTADNTNPGTNGVANASSNGVALKNGNLSNGKATATNGSGVLGLSNGVTKQLNRAEETDDVGHHPYFSRVRIPLLTLSVSSCLWP